MHFFFNNDKSTDQHISAHFRKVNVVLTSHREFISLHVIVNDQHMREIRMVLVSSSVFLVSEVSIFLLLELELWMWIYVFLANSVVYCK